MIFSGARMRSPFSTGFRPRRVLALAGLVSLAGGLLMLPGLAHPGRAAASAAARSAATATGCTGSGTIVTGHKLWDPSKGQALPTASCVTGGSGPFGPMNTAYATPAPDGTGQADVLIDTGGENQFLGCDQKHACSL